jgi:uncharacterized protein
MIGPIIDSSLTLVGGIAGGLLGQRLDENLRIRLPQIFGVVSMAMGVTMIAKLHSLPSVVIAIIFGTIVGEVIRLEERIGHVATRIQKYIEQRIPTPKATVVSPDEFLEKFVAVLVLFCASGTGIFGAMNEGITGDASLLLAKSVLDFFTAAIFATVLGMSVAAIAVPQLIIQMALFFLGRFILPLTTAEMVSDFSGCGGIIMLATGFRIAGIKSFMVANLLPSLLLVMVISRLWSKYVG